MVRSLGIGGSDSMGFERGLNLPGVMKMFAVAWEEEYTRARQDLRVQSSGFKVKHHSNIEH